MSKARVQFACASCGHRSSQWAGRCSSCGEWGTLGEARPGPAAAPSGAAASQPLTADAGGDAARRVPTGLPEVDRVLGGGLVPGSVVLLAGEPGIGKSTLVLQILAGVAARGLSCLLTSGEESRAQVAARAVRLGLPDGLLRYAPGRDLASVLATARADAPFLVAVDSIQTLRDTGGTQMPGGVSQIRTCTDALVGLAKEEGVAVVLTGHVTKDGDLAGPRALEHAVDVVLTFDGDPRSGLRVLSGGKNRFGAEGDTAWFEMGHGGLAPIDASGLLVAHDGVPGAAVALAQAGRRAFAVEVQALVGAPDGPGRRQVTGLDLRRFSLVAAVVDRTTDLRLGRAELFGASLGGTRVDDPACDLAIAAAIASAASSVPPPEGAAFVGEVALTGVVRPAPAMAARLSAARAAGCRVVYAPPGSTDTLDGLQLRPVRHVGEALAWALSPAAMGPRRLPA